MIEQREHKDLDVDIRALPAGTTLLNGQYRIERYLSSGGFGITYLATDSLNRRVVIKECFPEALCHRTDRTVRAKTSQCVNDFNALVEMFVREARSLAKVDHDNIVGVHQIFESNDTAYMALDFIDGRDAMQLIDAGDVPLPPDRIVDLTAVLLDAISAVHDADMLHRDISPDNILIDRSGTPYLIDFGAARQEATKKSRAISALMVVKDGYSPQEFYISGGKQGPASDLYSLAATLYHLITGEVPPNSQNRLAALAAKNADPYQPLATRIQGYDPKFLRAIDLAMSVFPKDRPQSARQWMAMADGSFDSEPGDNQHVRHVISNLVSEVALSIAQETVAEAKKAKAMAEAKPEPRIQRPEEDRWWPLTEPCEDTQTKPVTVTPQPVPEVKPETTDASRKTRRRFGALVLIAAVTLSVQRGLLEGQLNAALLGVEALIETVLAGTAFI